MRRSLAAGAAVPRIVRWRLQSGAGPEAGVAAVNRRIEQFRERRPDRLHLGTMRLRFRGLGFWNLGFRRFAGLSRGIGSLRHAGNMGRVRSARKGVVPRMRADAMVQAVREDEQAAAAFRRQSRHRQSLPWVGIGSRAVSSAHQQFPDRSQPNSVPQPEQVRRRAVCCPI